MRAGRRPGADLICRTIRELAVMLAARVPIDRALNVLIDQQENPAMRRALERLRIEIEAGQPLSIALSANSALFGRELAAAARAGEAAGQLPEILLRLCTHMETQQAMRRRMRTAMVYPVVLLTVTTLCVILLLGVVVPQLGVLIASVAGDAPLPLPTRAVLGIAGAGRALLPGFAVLAAGIPLYLHLLRRQGKSLPGLTHLPVVGSLITEQAVARGAATAATLTEAGVPLTDALLHARDTCGHPKVAESFFKVSHHIALGHRLSEALAAGGQRFPAAIHEMAVVAEESGQLPELMHHLARDTEARCLARTQAMVALIEPLLLVGIALFVGLVVAALFLPILQLLETLSGF